MATKKYKKWSKMKSIIEKYHKWLHGSPWDIFWAYIGTNIGSEICGHGDEWIRPVLIIKRYGNLHITLPLTSQGMYRDDSWVFCIKKYHHRVSSINFWKRSYIILNQVRTIDGKRFVQHYTDKNGSKPKLSIPEFLYIKNTLRRESK